MADFQPGDVVVCVDAGPLKCRGLVSGLALGSCYTVTHVESADPDPGVKLREVSYPEEFLRDRAGRLIHWCGFSASRFRLAYRPDGSFLRQCLEPVEDVA